VPWEAGQNFMKINEQFPEKMCQYGIKVSICWTMSSKQSGCIGPQATGWTVSCKLSGQKQYDGHYQGSM